jgi:biotin carboxyl carrier protein
VASSSWLAHVSDAAITVTRIADGQYRVEHDGRNEVLYIAGTAADRWVFWNGEVFRGDFNARETAGPTVRRAAQPQSVTAPMPARVISIAARPGAAVRKGDTLLVLEAMKMELPIRASADGTVAAVHCREGDLVQADQRLLDLT